MTYRFLITACFLILLCFPRATEASFGMSPAKIITPHLLQGQTYTEIITLTRSEVYGSVSLNTSLHFEHPDWVTINNNEPIFFEDQSQTLIFPVSITIPEQVPVGIYAAKITFQKDELAVATETDALTLLGSTLPVRILVTDKEEKHLRFIDATISADQHIFGIRRLTIESHIKNDGNVMYQPSRMNVRIYDETGTHILEDHIVDEFRPIPPFTADKIIQHISTNIPSGSYLATIQIFDAHLPITDQKISRPFIITWNSFSLLSRYANWLIIIIVLSGCAYAVHVHAVRKKRMEQDNHLDIL